MLDRSNEMLDRSNEMQDRSNDMLDRSNDMLDMSNEMFWFNNLKDNEGRRKQHIRSFIARREPRVLTLGQS
ncbi:hypothetical protein TNCV_4910241 [Trichonephila clavipes]|nr:hypothetical protein TNCV_4910241 [Trichonephila clavipes]